MTPLSAWGGEVCRCGNVLSHPITAARSVMVVVDLMPLLIAVLPWKGCRLKALLWWSYDALVRLGKGGRPLRNVLIHPITAARLVMVDVDLMPLLIAVLPWKGSLTP